MAVSRSRKKAEGKAKSTAQWTVMVYLAGDNSLDSAGTVDLLEMKKTGSGADLKIVAQFDRAGRKGTTRRFLLRKGTPLASDAVADLGETNTGDPAVLRDFLTWGIKTCPARHYLAVIWNHGAGWDDSNLYTGDYFGGTPPPVTHKGYRLGRGSGSLVRGPVRRGSAPSVPLAQARAALRRGHRALFGTTVRRMVTTRAIAFDDQAEDYLDNMELKRLLLDVKKTLGRKIDLLGFDACLMSMLEVAYQVKDAAVYTAGSQEEEPNNGWPYDRILSALAKKPSMTPAELSSRIVTSYLASYGSGDGVTFSATDLGKVDAAAAAVNALGAALSAEMGNASVRAAVQQVRSRVQEYTAPYDDYVDLVDLCDGLTKLAGSPAVTSACGRVRASVQAMVLQSGFKGSAVAHSHGCSIYFPKKKVCALYRNLDFSKKNAWSKFIDDYVAGLSRRVWD
jgi:cysteine peptidase C11 family protein